MKTLPEKEITAKGLSAYRKLLNEPIEEYAEVDELIEEEQNVEDDETVEL